ncbi:MAG: glucose-6-phosphate isomerase, partial [Pseudomonadota bacterium]
KVAGVDIDAIRSGASEIVKHTFFGKNSEPAKGAALSYELNKIGKNVSVMMPYCDRLDAFGAWHQQLWAESLGKNGNGTTALRAIGAFDQHSQLQLYLDGPKDKFITLLLLEQAKTGANIPPSNDPALAYLQNHTIGDLMAAEQLATCKTLIKNNCPIRTFSLKTLDEYALGSLMMHFMLETVITAALLGINAFDQPAVEESKQLARSYLSQS